MVTLRPYQPNDLEALYHICLVTGDAGKDASGLHSDPKLIGHIYAAPYAVLEPEHVLVAEDASGVVGYLVGTYDTAAFVERQKHEWWPALREHYADTTGFTAADRERVAAIIRPHVTPEDIVARYPAHIHMNLLQRARGQRVGTGLLLAWSEKARSEGVTSVHLGASAENAGGVAFWSRSGFTHQRQVGSTIWFGMDLA